MTGRVRTVRDYAIEAGLDLDEALVALWDAGLVEFDGPQSPIRRRHLAVVEQALKLPSRAELQTVAYWQDHLNLSREQLAKQLEAFGLHLSAGSRKVPKNAIRKLRHLLPPLPPPWEAPAEEDVPELPPFVWETIGRRTEIVPLELVDVVSIHEVLERDFANSADPIEPRGVRDHNLLESALTRPLTESGGERKYPTLPMSVSALFHSLIHNHAFYNGNKRTALVSLLVLLDRNGFVLNCTQNELFKQTVLTAQHRITAQSSRDLADREVLENARWIQAHSRPLDYRERPLKWLRLKQRLGEFGCAYSPAPGGGRALNIEREVTSTESRWRRVRRRTDTLRTQVSCPGDGTEASPDTIHKVRHDLHLDNANGVDSAAFYQGDSIDVFVSRYRRVLRRLATL